jgi:hypothetical protein
MIKRFLLLMTLFGAIGANELANAGEINYPGEAWVKYGHSTRQDGSDYDRGLLFMNVIQGVEYKRNMLYTGVSAYRPNLDPLYGSDNYIQLGIKHKTKIGLDFGIERQFVERNINRSVLFLEYYKTWDLK